MFKTRGHRQVAEIKGGKTQGCWEVNYYKVHRKFEPSLLWPSPCSETPWGKSKWGGLKGTLALGQLEATGLIQHLSNYYKINYTCQEVRKLGFSWTLRILKWNQQALKFQKLVWRERKRRKRGGQWEEEASLDQHHTFTGQAPQGVSPACHSAKGSKSFLFKGKKKV